ncbi:EAL and modified HD-GYP domain-containing signal transduction protein [Persephonella hydrogeniphila]|uniref:EAL and modified HD-GYP domain-containing signal transduction protein n=1 Tax=Persephonella hydrogeniphila TaxID=198703 RepID=A0A285NFB7_9AQUI|nr:HDOD domain-containing protein [Persephonella hydrogeniphila]SNZ08160.1 EAL and modified HD-GYP domain-containing signal transduction protein [Persephonella hydrogeniphila]
MLRGFYIAKQEIYDINGNVVGTELLFRKKLVHYAQVDNNFYSTISVLDTVVNSIGVENIIPTGFIFLNVDKHFIESEISEMLHPERIVFELVENIPPEKQTIRKLQILKDKGFKLSINNFNLERHKSFLPFLDFAKVNIVDTKDTIQAIDVLLKNEIKSIAFKVENVNFFKIAKSLGFSLFQGYYFSKPCFVSGDNFRHNKYVIIKILDSSLKREDIDKIQEYFKANPDIAIKLIKFINSPFFGLRKNISSIKKALLLLGYENLSKWLSLLLFLSEDRKGNTLEKATFRGKMMEQILSDINKDLSDKAFLTGILSYITDFLKDQDIIKKLSLDKDIKNALLNKKGILKDILDLLRFIETDRFEEVNMLMEKYNLSAAKIINYELKYFEWFNSIKDELGLH